MKLLLILALTIFWALQCVSKSKCCAFDESMKKKESSILQFDWIANAKTWFLVFCYFAWMRKQCVLSLSLATTHYCTNGRRRINGIAQRTEYYIVIWMWQGTSAAIVAVCIRHGAALECLCVHSRSHSWKWGTTLNDEIEKNTKCCKWRDEKPHTAAGCRASELR